MVVKNFIKCISKGHNLRTVSRLVSNHCNGTKKNLIIQKSVFAIFCCCLVLLGPGCEDPPPLPNEGAIILGVKTVLPTDPNPTLPGGTKETLEGLTGLNVEVERVDVVHRTVAGDPLTEQVITVDDTVRTFELVGDLQDEADRQLAFLNIPAGFVFQIRAIVKSASITLRGDTFNITLPVVVPSGKQTGIKIVPIDGVPFEVFAGERTGVEAVLNPFEQLIRNKGQGFKLKPVIYAELVELEELSDILLDRVVVRFKDGITRARIDEINASIGTMIVDYDAPTNYFILALPTSISLEGALEYYNDQDEIQFTLPDTIIKYRQVFPCDPNFQNPGPFTQVNAPQAWAVTQGDRLALLAVIDSGFDLTNPDMVDNYFINQDELTGVAAFDTNVDGIVTPAEILAFDTDGDNFITFVDLNDPANAGLAADLDADGVITPVDLVDGIAGNVGFEDGVDNDGNGRVDDLVGWDFCNGDNLPLNPGNTGCNGAHGVGVAGVVAAIGSAPLPPPAPCPSGLVAGMNWVGRIIPIQNSCRGALLNASTRAVSYIAIRYAVGLGADAINASWGMTFVRGGDPGCNRSISNLNDKYDELLPVLNQEGTSLALGNSVLVNAVDNCAQDNDQANIFDWPAELNDPNIIAVGGIQTNVVPPALAAFSAFGPGTIDIVAPATNHTLLDMGGGVNLGCDGNSFAAPMVTGTVGLIIAANVNPPIQGNAATVISRILCNATVAAGLAGQVGGGGRVLDVDASVNNANNCP